MQIKSVIGHRTGAHCWHPSFCNAVEVAILHVVSAFCCLRVSWRPRELRDADEQEHQHQEEAGGNVGQAGVAALRRLLASSVHTGNGAGAIVVGTTAHTLSAQSKSGVKVFGAHDPGQNHATARSACVDPHRWLDPLRAFTFARRGISRDLAQTCNRSRNQKHEPKIHHLEQSSTNSKHPTTAPIALEFLYLSVRTSGQRGNTPRAVQAPVRGKPRTPWGLHGPVNPSEPCSPGLPPTAEPDGRRRSRP